MYRIEYSNIAIRSLKKLDKKLSKRIREKIHLLATDPYADNNNVKALKGSDLLRLRVADYRVIYKLQDDIMLINIVEVAHRKEVYRT